MPRIQLPPSAGSPELNNSSWSSSGAKQSTTACGLPRSRRFLYALLTIFLGLPLSLSLFHLYAPASSEAATYSSQAALQKVWKSLGSPAQDRVLREQQQRLCERTLLWKFSGKSGFGSEYGMFLRAATWAHDHDYTLLTASENWAYGDYEDYFNPPAITCSPPEGSADPANRNLVKVGSRGWENAPHLFGQRSSDVYKAVDQWLMDTHIDLDAIKALPNLNLDEPLPIGQTVTDGIKPILARENEIMRGLWRPKPRLYEMVQNLEHELGLVDGVERGHVIGVHYRGGDKLLRECPWSVCGNATALLETAMNTIASLPPASCTSCKPTIALMTIEPDALSLFQASPLSHHFNILALPPPPGGLRGHTQKQFNQAESAEIVEDTFTMLRDISVLSLKADAFVVSAASNVGVVAIALGGPERPVHSVDFRFKATTRPLQEYLTGKSILSGTHGH